MSDGYVNEPTMCQRLEPLRFIQIWITPRSRGLKPNYGSTTSSEEQRINQWAHLVSDVRVEDAPCVKVQQDINIFVTELDSGRELAFDLESGRQAYALCVEGSVTVSAADEQASLAEHDACELYGESGAPLVFRNDDSGNQRAHLLLVEMQQDGSGRTDL